MTEAALRQPLSMPQPRRAVRLIQQAVRALALDLSGATVVTEAATGAWAAAPVLAATAGAAVHAISQDSAYGSAADGVANVQRFATLAGVPEGAIAFHHDRKSLPSNVDVITNLGHVRPLDSDILGKLGGCGVVSLMYEDWELRDADVDVAYCRRHGIPVGGVWEDFGMIRAFSSCGLLAVKQCFSAGLEVAGNRIIVVSRDAFGDVIVKSLRDNFADVVLVPDAECVSRDALRDADAILVADYYAESPVLGADAGPSPWEIADINPHLVIIQFVGPVDVGSLAECGLRVVPPKQLRPQEMAATLDKLGVRTAIFLHAGGLKVGELLWRQRRTGQPFGAFEPLVQLI